jgi:hypothetical protein
MQALALPPLAPTSAHLSASRHPPRQGGTWPSLAGFALLASLASCHDCSERTPEVCCTSDSECARLSLPPGSVSDYSCGEGHVCRDFYCVPAEGPDAREPDVDAAIDAPSGRCNPNAPFGAPTRMPNVNSQFEELSMAMTYDQLKVYVGRSNGTSYGIATSKRGSVDSDFPAPTTDPALAAIPAGATYTLYLYPTSDDLAVYYRRDQTWFASSRPTPNDAFDAGTQVYVNGTPLPAHRAMISANSVTVYWSGPSIPLQAATKGLNYNFAAQRAVTIFDLTDFAISADELTLYYSNNPNPDIFRTTRSSRNVPFDVGLPVANVNTTGADVPLYVSPDDCFLYLRASATGSTQDNDIWVARRGR